MAQQLLLDAGEGGVVLRPEGIAGPSGMTSDLSVRMFSGRFEKEHNSASFSTAGSEAIARHRGKAHGASYMANTESSRAKQAQSQSAPQHRPEAASPSRSYERPPSGSGGRRRASLDLRDLAGATTPWGGAGRTTRGGGAGHGSCGGCTWRRRPETPCASL
ncbi:hypothetical protein ZWY2020_059227 [Hordeum vulgare]|nr:hypothetical protein ZWY2020_059227 [Hordeum vulgare]